MNWLAHIFLSLPTVENRLGNLLGDLVKGKDIDRLHPLLQDGLKRHYAIDRFTDSHLLIKTSKQRIDPEYCRFAGVLVDVFYDHFLAKNWEIYSEVSLAKFITEVYTSFQAYPHQLPELASQTIERMIRHDWLTSYREIAGIEHTLKRIDYRIQKRMGDRIKLANAMPIFEREYEAINIDFQSFFPELRQYINNWQN
jgi:acyl carrier protein phosphodiesterase